MQASGSIYPLIDLANLCIVTGNTNGLKFIQKALGSYDRTAEDRFYTVRINECIDEFLKNNNQHIDNQTSNPDNETTGQNAGKSKKKTSTKKTAKKA